MSKSEDPFPAIPYEFIGGPGGPKLTYEERAAIDAVIEEHRVAIGAESVHVTLGDNPTAEGLREALKKSRAENDIYNSFSKVEQLEATIARLKNDMHDIYQSAKINLDNLPTDKERIKKMTDVIYKHCDMIADVCMVEDTCYMIEKTVKRKNKVLSPEVQEWYNLNREKWPTRGFKKASV